MEEAWEKHIRPLLDPRNGGPPSENQLLSLYPKLAGNEKIKAEDALVRCAFVSSDDDIATKALALAVALHKAQLATGGLARQMRVELRNRLPALDIDRPITGAYVSACGAFGLTEALPSIRALAAHAGPRLMSSGSEDTKDRDRALLRECCLSLRRLGDDQARLHVSVLVEYDLCRSMLTTPELGNLSPERTIEPGDLSGFSVLRGIVGFFRELEAGQRSRAMQMLDQAARGTGFRSDRERQEALRLIGGLGSAATAQPPASREERARNVRRKQSSQDAFAGLALAVFSLVLTVALLVLGWFFGFPIRTTTYGLITILVTLVFGLVSALSALYEASKSEASRAAPPVAILTLAVCALVVVGLLGLAWLILSI